LTRPEGDAIVDSPELGLFFHMDSTNSHPVTELLGRWKSGDQEALAMLIPLVYKELREIAQYHLRRERPGHTLQSGALVNEAYLRLLGQHPDTQNRSHFLAVSSRLMRQILVDHARNFGAAKRGSDRKVELASDIMSPQPNDPIELIVLNDALDALTLLDEQQGRIVELRFFGGLSTEEAAEVLNISPATVKRDWSVAKAWLSRKMKRGAHGRSGPLAAD
jgi:RNA polymerase sigma-70 factor (ECF subfamily)